MGFKDLMKSAADGATGLVKNELAKKDSERQLATRRQSQVSAFITIKNGPAGMNGACTIRQRQEDGLIYFGVDENRLYELLDYSWDGPLYGSMTNTQTTGISSSQTVKKGKAGKMTAGAVVGTLLMPGIGTAVGAAIGAGSKGKSTTQGNMSSNSRQMTQHIEQAGTAVLKLRRIDDGMTFPISIACTTEIDAQIRCFQIKKEQSVAEVSKNTTDALKGIKALKELLDMGAISEEEFETKKKQLLNS